ncbi:unnamed protein product [Symbiodinium natans]|uniref:Uncharacterized protein n=1 Tax=Symbiodinium natans TaxID=878477 RepID=A0A812J9Z5_9DINO|nr:unnamed protein product [Symbiodinium natans]
MRKTACNRAHVCFNPVSFRAVDRFAEQSLQSHESLREPNEGFASLGKDAKKAGWVQSETRRENAGAVRYPHVRPVLSGGEKKKRKEKDGGLRKEKKTSQDY